jgi:hypothetical protein
MGVMVRESCIAGRKVGTAGSSITPGCLICLCSDGTVAPVSGTGCFAAKTFALETDDINSNYKINDAVPYKYCHAGDQVSAFLKNGETVVIGDLVCCAGNGVFKKVSTTTEIPLAVSTEAMTAVGDTRLVIEII